MMLLASRYGWRVSERMHLRWDQLALAQGLVHVRRVTNGVPSTHPLTEAAMRALRVHGDALVLRGLRESAGKV